VAGAGSVTVTNALLWLAATFECETRGAGALSDALLDAGALSVDVGDAAAGLACEEPRYAEAGTATEPLWPRARITALFPDGTDVAAALVRAREAAGVDTIERLTVGRVPEQDWVRQTQQQFTPVRISSRLWIVPSWSVVPDTGAVNVVLDPGLAFGTGTHATTQLVLRWLERTVRGGETVIDYGCGSGILGIAALKLGAGVAHGVDIDEQARLAASRNAVQNQVALHVSDGGRLAGGAQIVMANILARPLIVLAPLLASLTERRGALALSGILADQLPELIAAYRPWFDLEATERQEEWVLLCGNRR
jgi:ribosomal protein L11 methyltransferase